MVEEQSLINHQTQIAIQTLLQQGCNIKEALDGAEDINPIQFDNTHEKIHNLYVEQYDEGNAYLSVNYDDIINNEFTEFTIVRDKYNTFKC